MIILDNVSKSYTSGQPALNGINLNIKQGEFVLWWKQRFREIHTDKTAS